MLKKQNGFGLIAVIFSMMAVSAMGLSMSSMISNNAGVSSADLEGQQAFYVTEGGLHYTLTREFMVDMDYSNNTSPTGAPYGGTPISLGGGQFWIQYSNQSRVAADVTITGRVGSSTRVIRQSVAMAIPVSYPVYSGGNVSFGGNRRIFFLPSGILFGDVAAGGTITHPNHFFVMGTKTPNTPMTLPEVDVSRIADEITTTTHEGNLTITGYYNQNVHVTGDVTIQGGAIIDGNVVSDGTVTIAGNVISVGTIAAAEDINGELANNSAFIAQDGENGEVLPALMAGGNVSLNAEGLGTLISGMVITGGTTTIRADLSPNEFWGEAIILNGGVMSQGDFTLFNERGFILVNGDEDLVESLAQGGNLNLSNWQEN
ncbi:MAG: hypothetical protein KBC91_00155 [Candidatus Omnitrophica bacterium]|nr:hypothetical protein [Candidatus Omnitrophota bacterium]